MMRERWAWLAAVAICVLVVYRCDAKAQQEIGALNLRSAQLASANDSLHAVVDSLDTKLEVDTVTAYVTRDRWRTLIDSFTHFDTVHLTRRETLIVERATAALGGCQQALGTCIASVRARDALIANRDSAFAVELARRPSFFDKARSAVVFAAAGYLLHAVQR